MKNTRHINPSDIRMFYFGSQDVLSSNEEKESRKQKLERAMILSNCEHIPISLCMKLPNGEMLETESDVVDYADDIVVLKGGHYIPVWAILDVDV
ncbi:hypothetical protein [Chryseolinea sp. H1M3-3]|uniref:hypothetical protein n=1 Tax=Chryseolinea sp. H1M3-3 TaxID=3034144 RepID=UPI0023EBCA68|nr:hypothetical protein [Chryseolinea sp. H1M3-3]